MHPTEILGTEHKAVLVALKVLEKAGQSLAPGTGRPSTTWISSSTSSAASWTTVTTARKS